MRGIRWLLAVALVLGLAATPALAEGAADDPEIVDDCGVGTHSVDKQPLPWHDICAGWFETLSGPDATSEIRVTLELAGHLELRTDSMYSVSWRAGGCGFGVDRYDAGRDGSLSGDPTAELWVSCESGKQVDCDPPILDDLGFVCGTLPPQERFDISDGYAEDGDTLSWTIRFDGELAEFADTYEYGATLSEPGAITGANAAGGSLTLASCTRANEEPWECRAQLGDWVPEGRDYVVGR